MGEHYPPIDMPPVQTSVVGAEMLLRHILHIDIAHFCLVVKRCLVWLKEVGACKGRNYLPITKDF